MANFVTNRITLIGNEAIQKLAQEINRRFSKDQEKNKATSVGRILFGLEGGEANLTSEINAKWVHSDGPFYDAEPLRLISGWRPVTEIQDHILLCAAKLDPKVIVYMEYDDEMPNFVGARYTLLDDDEIIEFHNVLDTSEYTVVMEDDVESIKEELRNQDQDDSKVIWWEDLWDLLNDQKVKSLNEMKSKYKYTKNIKDDN